MAEPVLADRWDLSTRIHDPVEDLLTLQPGRLVELAGRAGLGLARLGYRMLAAPSRVSPVVALDVRGWMAPQAAWEVGVERDHLVVVRCPESTLWPRVAAALFEGVRAVYAEVPPGVREQDLRRLSALARARQVHVALRPLQGGLPPGIAYLRLQGMGVRWHGTDRGHGRLSTRTLILNASGKGAAGIDRRIEVEDFGADVVRVVSNLVARPVGRAG